MGGSHSFVPAFALVGIVALSPMRWRHMVAAQSDNRLVSIDNNVSEDELLGAGAMRLGWGFR